MTGRRSRWSQHDDPTAAGLIASEAHRLYRRVRWRGPTGSATAALLIVALLRGRVESGRLVIWFSAVVVACLIMTATFAVPSLARERAASGLPRFARPAHVLVGATFGSLLWIAPVAASEPLAWWPIVALQLGVTAGAVVGVSGLGYTLALSMWTLSSAALWVQGQWLIAIATTMFLVMVTSYSHETGAMWRELIALRVQQGRIAEEFEHQAAHDPLTGLLNRAGVNAALDDLVTATGMFIDLDHFKEVNDRYGHTVGDLVLCDVAVRLRQALPGVEAIARIGGDEFFVVFPEMLDVKVADEIGARIIAALERPFPVADDVPVWISASIGHAPLDGSDERGRLMTDADHAMFLAKRRGRRQVARFTPSLQAELSERTGLESRLRQAIHDRELSSVGQPIVDLATGRIHAVELLARWHPDGGRPVSPGLFVPLAEEVGLADDLTLMLLDDAGRLFARWKDDPQFASAMVSINISPRQVATGALVDMVQSAIERHGFAPERLMLELTESATVGDLAATVELFEDLDQLGVSLAIDDFGTGYSSLGHLLSLPVSSVKIDRSLVAGIGDEDRRRAVMTAVRDLAVVLGQDVIAEGVETETQRKVLLDLGIGLGQGFGLCRPLALERLRRGTDIAVVPLGEVALVD